MVCAAPKRLLHTARTAEPRHIVAGVRFHWSREERRFQRERFVGREPGLYSPRQHEREGKPEKVNMLVFLWKKKKSKSCQRQPV